MSDELDLTCIDRRFEPDEAFRQALRHRVMTIVDASETTTTSETPASRLVRLDQHPSEPPHRSRAARFLVVAASLALIVAAASLLLTRHSATSPAETHLVPTTPPARPPATDVGTTAEADDASRFGSILEYPTDDEIARAGDHTVYVPDSGTWEITPERNFISLRTCPVALQPCAGPEGWAYVTGSADGERVHAGLLGAADHIDLSVLDGRFFVATARSSSDGVQGAPNSWLVDSDTGRRGLLNWQDHPTVLDSPDELLVLQPAHRVPGRITVDGVAFLPRIVDASAGTLSPLNVPQDASAALVVDQSGIGRIWVGTAPDGGRIGLAYTDDGGATWTHVELPDTLRRTSEEVVNAAQNGVDEVLEIAAAGDRVAVSAAWVSASLEQRTFVSADAGVSWDPVPFEATGNGRGLFVMNDRLVLSLTVDPYLERLYASTSASDWSLLESIDEVDGATIVPHSVFTVGQGGIASIYRPSMGPRSAAIYSSDLVEWWPIDAIG